MKALFIGNGLEILFNQEMSLNQMKTKGLEAIDHLNNGKLEKFLNSFFETDTLFADKQEALLENYSLIFKKLIMPSLIQKTDQYSIEHYLNEISWKIKSFLNENKIGLNTNVIEVFIKHIFLFYIDQQWTTTAKKLKKFLKTQAIKNYFNQFDVFLTTNYTPILEVINSQLDFPVPAERLINLYGKFEEDEPDSYNDVALLWQGKRKNQVDFWKTLKGFEINQLEIVGFNFYDDENLLKNLIGMLQSQQGMTTQINYLGYEQTDLDQFHQLLVDSQIQQQVKLAEYNDFKQKERNGELTVLKTQTEVIKNYGYVINHDRYSMNNLALTRKSATILKTEFYYNLNKLFEDGYDIEDKKLLVETTNRDGKNDLIINFLEFNDYFAGTYNQAFKEYFNLVPEPDLIDAKSTEKPAQIVEAEKLDPLNEVEVIEKRPIIISHEVVQYKKPNAWVTFWNNLFAKKHAKPKENKAKIFFEKLFKPKKVNK